jgi:hypothetical protein
MNNILLPQLPPKVIAETMMNMEKRIELLSNQVNYLLTLIYKSNPNHPIFQRNARLKEDVRKAIEFEEQRSRLVKEQIDTPDYTREKLTELKERMKPQ